MCPGMCVCVCQLTWDVNVYDDVEGGEEEAKQ